MNLISNKWYIVNKSDYIIGEFTLLYPLGIDNEILANNIALHQQLINYIIVYWK